jgi:hypothetical protein
MADTATTLARIDERTEAMQGELARLAAKVDTMANEQAELRGALRFAKWAGSFGGGTGLAGLVAAFAQRLGSAP